MKKNLVPFTKVDENLIRKVSDKRAGIEIKYPLIFGLLTTFGFVSTLYGFEKLIDKIDLFVNNPWILLATGIATLVATGAAYKKLN